MKEAKKKTRDETKSKKGTRKKNQSKALVAELDQLCIDVDSSDSELTATCQVVALYLMKIRMKHESAAISVTCGMT